MFTSPSPCRICTGLDLHRACACWHNHCKLICTSAVSRHSILVVVHSLWLLHSFRSLFYNDPWVLNGDSMHTDLPLSAENYVVSNSLNLANGGSLGISFSCKEKLLWWGLGGGLIYRCNNQSVQVSLTMSSSSFSQCCCSCNLWTISWEIYMKITCRYPAIKVQGDLGRKLCFD